MSDTIIINYPTDEGLTINIDDNDDVIVNIIDEPDIIVNLCDDLGTTANNYDYLDNKPSINNVELVGNKTLDDLGIEPKKGIDDFYLTNAEKTQGALATGNAVLPTVKDVADKSNIDNDYELIVYRVDEENLYIASKFDDNNDIIIHFKKCMFNELMTFYKVGLAANTNSVPSDNITRALDVSINKATSDNIGPVSITGYGFVGANHSFNNDGVTKTAMCIDYSFKCDGIDINIGQKIRCNNVSINVINTLVDPSSASGVAPNIVFAKNYIEEHVNYSVTAGNIEVMLSHKYLNDVARSIAYYGMQSMATGNEILYINAGVSDFVTKTNGIVATKANYPNFNTFVQRNTSKTWYEACFLNPVKFDGDHKYVISAGNVFNVSSNKAYHQVAASGVQPISGKIISWHGVYTWFKPLVDNSDLLAYYATIDSKKSLVTHFKTANSTILNDDNLTNKLLSVSYETTKSYLQQISASIGVIMQSSVNDVKYFNINNEICYPNGIVVNKPILAGTQIITIDTDIYGNNLSLSDIENCEIYFTGSSDNDGTTRKTCTVQINGYSSNYYMGGGTDSGFYCYVHGLFSNTINMSIANGVCHYRLDYRTSKKDLSSINTTVFYGYKTGIVQNKINSIVINLGTTSIDASMSIVVRKLN